MKKRIISLCLSALMIVSCIVFTSCGDKKDGEETYSRMTVDINPSVEFMLDSENKVASVTGLNDDGSILIAGEAFIGKTPEEATEMVISLATETGYLVKGSATVGNNEVKISISGNTEAAETLRKNVEAKAKEVLEKLDIEGKVTEIEALKTDELRKLALKTSLFTEDEVNKMTEEQLYNAIAAGRIETALLLTEDMRDAYYNAKDYKVSFAQSEATAEIIDKMGDGYNTVYALYKAGVDAYSSAITALDEFRYNSLVSPDSEYQKTLKQLREAKAEYLKERTYVASLDVNGEEYASASVTLKASEDDYDRLVAAYEALGSKLNESLNSLIAALRKSEEYLRSLEDKFSDNIKEELQNKANEIENSVNEAKDNFFNEFENAHKADIEAARQSLINQKNTLIQNAKGEQSK